jgi:hypothetical protein
MDRTSAETQTEGAPVRHRPFVVPTDGASVAAASGQGKVREFACLAGAAGMAAASWLSWRSRTRNDRQPSLSYLPAVPPA